MKNCLKTRLSIAVALLFTAGMVHAQAAPVESDLSPVAVAVPAPAVEAPAPSVEPVSPAFSSMNLFDQDIGNDDLVRDVARYRTREGRIDALSDLEKAQLEREKARIQSRLELLELQTLLANDGKVPEEAPAEPAPGSPEAAALALAVYEPKPMVRSIYGHGNNSFAEIYIGSAKIVATQGTILATGERVVDISPAGVVVVKGGRRQVLQVVGSAGVQPAALAPAPAR